MADEKQKQVDDFGWPVRIVAGQRRCAREGCKDTEFRIDGYCSCECRDKDDCETEIRELHQRLTDLEAKYKDVVEALDDVYVDRNEARGTATMSLDTWNHIRFLLSVLHFDNLDKEGEK